MVEPSYELRDLWNSEPELLSVPQWMWLTYTTRERFPYPLLRPEFHQQCLTLGRILGQFPQYHEFSIQHCGIRRVAYHAHFTDAENEIGAHDWQKQDLNPGLSDFQSLGPFSYLTASKGQGLRFA